MKQNQGFVRRSSVCTVLMLSGLAPLLAQPSQSPPWTTITSYRIKPDMRTEFEAAQKEVTAAYKKANVPFRIVTQTVFGDLFEYTGITPLAKFADMDAASPLVRALGEEGSARLLRKTGAAVLSIQRVSSREIQGMAVRTPGTNETAALIVQYDLIPGKSAEFEAWMKNEYFPAMKKAEVKNFWVSQTVFGADPNERVSVRLLNNLAEIDAGPATQKALGVEGAAKMTAKTAGFVRAVHFSVVRYRADLSYQPAMQASSK
jgi:hypothetical protein